MTLTCTSRYAGHGVRCQDRQHPDGLHHGHTDDQCLQWADGGVHFSKPISDCQWPPAHEVAQRAEELGAMIKARRERILVAAVDHPDHPGLRAAVKELCDEDARQADKAEAPVDLHAVRARANEHAEHQARMGWQCCRSHASADDVPVLIAEIEQLSAELAKSRRDALFAASEVAESVQADTSADKALRATIVAKLRIAAMADDKCAKCDHRHGDHRHGGVCTVRRSATTHCACREYGFAAPKEG